VTGKKEIKKGKRRVESVIVREKGITWQKKKSKEKNQLQEREQGNENNKTNHAVRGTEGIDTRST